MTSGASLPLITNCSLLFSTPWMRVVGKTVDTDPSEHPYYAVEVADYVSVVPFTPKREELLVRQFRPAVEEITLEFPSEIRGPRETPVENGATRSPGRNRLRHHAIGKARPADDRYRPFVQPPLVLYAEVTSEPTQAVVEEGIIAEKVPCDAFLADIGSETPRFAHALNLAALCLAQARGLVPAC